jgi:hypothetical protein
MTVEIESSIDCVIVQSTAAVSAHLVLRPARCGVVTDGSSVAHAERWCMCGG